MNITKDSSTCKSASLKLLNPVDIGSGNIIPNWWYAKILTTSGKAYTMAIALLSELWFLYRSTGQEEHQKDYDYFCNKFIFFRLKRNKSGISKWGEIQLTLFTFVSKP